MDILTAILFLLALGACGGFLAGLLGVGGGAVFVPGIYYILTYFGYPDHAMHIAVGTSLLIIVLTGTSSAYAHYKRGAVDLNLVRSFLPGVLIGVGIGTFLSDIVSTQGLKVIFALSQIIFGSVMLLRVNKTQIFNAPPRQPFFSIISMANACLATMMGVGGGIQNVMFMTLCNVSIYKAIATAATIGPFIAIFGATGFLYIGLGQNNLPPYTIGFLNLAIFGAVILSSIIFAPIGAKMAHSLPVPKLKRYFSIFVLMIAMKMLMDVYTG